MTNDQAKWVGNLIFVKNVNRFGPSLPKSHKLGKIKTGSRPDIGQFITKEQGTVAFCKTDGTRFRYTQFLQFLKKSDKIFLLKKKNSQRKITCHRAQTLKKEDKRGQHWCLGKH